MARFRSLGALTTLAIVLAGCSDYSQLSFRQDKRLQVLTPQDRGIARLPVTVRWRIDDFVVAGRTGTAAPNQGYFGLFVDRAPVPGGEPLSYIARKDRRCRPQHGCPNAGYLASHQVFTTTATEYTFAALNKPDVKHRKEKHTITIVLLDGTGRRIGESAWSVTFTLQRGVP